MSTSLWDAPIWHDSGTWIVLGISLLFLVVGVVMHRIIMKVVSTPPMEPPPNSDQHSPPPH